MGSPYAYKFDQLIVPLFGSRPAVLNMQLFRRPNPAFYTSGITQNRPYGIT
jgi:hypothetical protein